MRLGRLVLVIGTLVTILLFPIVAKETLQTVTMPSAYAQAVGRDLTGGIYQDNDNNNDGSYNGNDDSDNEDESGDNDNVTCYRNLNSNDEVPCDFDDDNGNHDGKDHFTVRRDVRHRGDESVNRPTKCFDAREVGVVQLGTGSFDVTVQVMPHSSLGQTTRLTLSTVNPSSVPAPTGSLVDSVVYQLRAQSSCDGADINPLPNAVNMGIIYNVPNAVDKSRLQIVRLEGGTWVNVDTVPDPAPGNPYVSTTITTAGTYALIQR